ncbi:hypothetical protein PM082_024306 [Marasmius tenuissimus]|nr:hypothetical protein PM082_024306 [Marasmius tenuissimus]
MIVHSPSPSSSPILKRRRIIRKTPEFTSDDDSDDAPLKLRLVKSVKRKRFVRAILSSDSEQENPKTTPVKAKCTRTKKRKMVAETPKARTVFLEIPIDVFAEIAKSLDPYDLMCLARTNRPLREMLMSRKYSNLWRASRANVEGLPPLPTDLSEPAFIEIHDLQGDMKYRTLNSHSDLLEIVPKRGPASFLRSAIEQFTAELDQINDHDSLKLWFEAKSQAYGTILQHSLQCQAWAKIQRNKRKAELAAVRDRRFQRAKEILVGEGWGKELEDRALFSHPFFRENKDFSYSAWARSKDSVIELLRKIRKQIAEDEERRRARYFALREAYGKLRTDNPYSILPSLGDLVSTKQIWALVEDMPLWKNLAVNDVASFIRSPLFDRLAEGWRNVKEGELFDLLCRAVPSTTKLSALHLATTVFRCNAVDCGKHLFYPHVLIHPCTSSPSFQPLTVLEKNNDSTPFIPSDACQIVESVPWNAGGDRIIFDHEASSHARAIVEACGLDPSQATAADLVMKNPLFECVTCRDLGDVPQMRWPQVLRHLPSGEVLVHAHQTGTRDQSPPPVVCPSNGKWIFGVRCVRCDFLSNPRSELFFEHLRKEHAITQVVRGDWSFDLGVKYYLDCE